MAPRYSLDESRIYRAIPIAYEGGVMEPMYPLSLSKPLHHDISFHLGGGSTPVFETRMLVLGYVLRTCCAEPVAHTNV